MARPMCCAMFSFLRLAPCFSAGWLAPTRVFFVRAPRQRAGTTQRKGPYVFPALKHGANEKPANSRSPSDNAALKIGHCIIERLYLVPGFTNSIREGLSFQSWLLALCSYTHFSRLKAGPEQSNYGQGWRYQFASGSQLRQYWRIPNNPCLSKL